MRFSLPFRFLMVMTAISTAAVVASPARFKRGINCASADDDGTPLTGSSSSTESGCGPCTYFFADGSFSSGSSTCPKGLPQDTTTGGSTSSSSSTSSGTSSGSISSSINCASTDDDGTPLISSASSTESGNEFATCTYKDAGPCTYFFADGSFSAGSSTCPKGLPQTGGSGGGDTTTSTTAARTTTTSTPPPATTTAARTTTTSTPPPTTTTTTSTSSTSTSSSTTEAQATVLSTSTSTLLSTVLSLPPTSTSQEVTSAPTSTANDSVTTVLTTQTQSVAPSGVSNAGSGSANAARARFSGSTALGVGAVPLALCLWALV
ncbi:hypothetical protein B0H10DRAFT_2100486 [Mycena sp. CBHHK59/15]|nr:hypothetical protein B0H10DRAFT_2100486 [Mycena sp. CBHHK59/15]